jgi:chloramphenicol O-acetyltransferase type A
MPHYLDIAQWPRKAAFDFFRTYDNPYFNVCVPLEAGALVDIVRGGDVSFSTACLYFALRAANEYEPMRYRLTDGRVLVHDVLHAGTTALLGEELAFVYIDYDEDVRAFQRHAAAARAALGAGATRIDARDDATDLIHFSSLPWIAFTSISHARNWRREDSVPKITFGRYHRVGDRVVLPVSVEVHHALMDGLHVAAYLDRLQAFLAEPGPALGGQVGGGTRA